MARSVRSAVSMTSRAGRRTVASRSSIPRSEAVPMKQTHRLRPGLLVAAVLATAVVASPAQAQRLSLAERVDRLEQQQNGQGANPVDLVNQVQALQSEVQQLQGQVDELKHQLDVAGQRNKDQYIDLDSRLGRLEGHAPGGAPAGPGPGARDSAPPPDI